jgi:hypothetical protein
VVLGDTAKVGCVYSWSPKTGLDDSTKAQPSATPTQTTTYILSLKDTNHAGCKYIGITTDTITITVNDCTPASPTYITKLYPNPNDGNFTLEYNLQSNGSFNLYDVLGQELLKQPLLGEAGIQNINTVNLSSGIYFWEIATGNEVAAKGKIAIMK